MNHETRLTDMDSLGPFIEANISEEKKVRLTVTGDSMYPLFKSRMDTVILDKPINVGKYDIVFFKRSNGRYILHRILKKKNGCFVIAGDNETAKEYPVRKEQIIGKVTGFYRKGSFHKSGELFYKFYGFIWVNIFPVRHILLRYFMKMNNFFYKIRKKKKSRKENDSKEA